MVQQYLPIKNNVLIVGNGTNIVENITAATLVKNVAGRVAKVSVIVAGSASGMVNDAATVGGAATANDVAVIPNTVGVYEIDLPTNHGIVVTPGTGQTLAVSYS